MITFKITLEKGETFASALAMFFWPVFSSVYRLSFLPRYLNAWNKILPHYLLP